MTLNQFKKQLGLGINTYDKCECYEDHCIKRKILVTDFFTAKITPVLICNSIIKLLIENVDYENRYYEDYHSGYYHTKKCVILVRDFYESISIEHHEEKYKKNNLFLGYREYGANERDINNILISNLILESPKLYKSIFLKDCIDIFLENEDYYLIHDIKKQIVYQLSCFIRKINQYKKYNSLTQKVTCNLKKFENGINKDYATGILMTILLDLFETEIKTKG